MIKTSTNLTNRHYDGRAGNGVCFIGIHTMEAPERSQTAENVANYFKTVNASAHWCHDDNSRVRSVLDKDSAWTLPGANYVSLNLELAGYAKQDADDWNDKFSIEMLEGAALSAAEWVIKYNIPIRHLNDSQIARFEKGFVGHVDVNRVFKKSSHWDPGPSFPWKYFLGRVRAYKELLEDGKNPSPPPQPNWDNRGYSMEWIRRQQKLLNEVGYDLEVDGKLGPKTRAATKDFQKKHGLEADGIPGPKTNKALRAEVKDEGKDNPNKKTRTDCRPLQRAVRTKVDNKWGPNTDKHCDAVREASRWGGVDFPYGVKFAQRVVGTEPDGKWGPKSRAAHDQTVIDVQQALKEMGYKPGKVDGKWGPNTESAYQAARKDCHI